MEWYAREIALVASVAYNDVDFREVVNDFNEGMQHHSLI